MKQTQHLNPLLLAIAIALLALPGWTAAAAQSGAPTSSEAYGYFRTVEGPSLLSTREPEETRDLEMNLPILAGDAVQVGRDARVEAVLADGSVTRLESGTELVFDELAGSPDSPGATATRLALLAGEIQIRVPDETAATAPPEIESASARIYLIRGGSYWIGVTGASGARLIVREGAAEILTDQGSSLVQAGEEVEVSDRYGLETRVARAGYERDIERWAHELERQAYLADHGPVEEPLRYQAAPLARSGSWVRVDGRVAWRPRVRHGWRPFTEGRWVYTPSGLTWVASTSWGYVTSHYGSWDYLPSYGWCWFPGRTYSPAWVYWYWGPTHAAWVPYGYYARHYGPRYGWSFGFGHGYGLRFGVYGYAGGGWSAFADWTFCPLGYFGRRGGHHYYRSGHELGRHRGGYAVPRGIITTDTRYLDRAVWTRPYEARRRLTEVHRGRVAKERFGAAADLPDVTPFVTRRRELPRELEAVVKPRIASEGRPALGRITRPVGPTPTDHPRLSSRSTGLGATRQPSGDGAAERQVTPGRVVGRSSEPLADRREAIASRFETKPARRPTEFERAPTTIYRSSGLERPRIDGGKTPATRPSGRSPLSGAARSADPGTTDRAPSALERRPATPLGGERERPSSLERTPTRIDTERPVLERRPLVDPRDRASSPVYRQPERQRQSLSDRGAIERGPSSFRLPSAGELGSRLPSRPAAPSSRQEIGSSRGERPSLPSTRAPVSPSRSSGSRVESLPSRSPSSRVESAPSRSPSSRVESAPSGSPSSRVESAPSRSTGSRIQSAPSRPSSSRTQSTPSRSSTSRVQSAPSPSASSRVQSAPSRSSSRIQSSSSRSSGSRVQSSRSSSARAKTRASSRKRDD